MNTNNSGNQFGEGFSGARTPANDDTDTIDIFEIFRSVWRRKWIVFGCAAVLGILVAIGVSLATPRYSATAKVMLNPRDTRVVTSQEVVSDLDLSNPVIESEVALIQSSVLLEKALREIGKENLREFDPLREEEPQWTTRLDNGFQWATRFLEGNEPAATIEETDPALGETQDSLPLNEKNKNDSIYRRLVGQVRKYVAVNQQGKSYVISISAQAENSELVAKLVNTIADQYIASQLEERIEGTRRANRWLETRVDDLRNQVALAEDALETHRAKKLIADGGSIESAQQQLAAMSSQLAVARADKAAAEARYTQISDLVTVKGAAAANEVLTSQLVNALREDLAHLLRERAELATRFQPDHPQMMRINAEIGRAEEDLNSEVGKIIKSLEQEVQVAAVREQSISSDVLALEERVSSISRTSMDLLDLERESNALRSVYENMLSRLKETRAHEALAQAEAKVIESALPPGLPTYPRSKLLIMAAIVAGASLGLGLVLVLELSFKGLRSPQQLARETGVPVLAVLSGRPRGRWRAKTPATLAQLREAAKGPFGEGVRQLRTTLMFASSDPPRSIVITSSLPGEGKTQTALTLAHMNAIMGKRVIFVDCDFRYARLSSSFGWMGSNDLVSVLRGDAKLEAAIISDPTVGFDCLPVLDPAPHISDLLPPGRFRAIIEQLHQSYDLVVIDAPAILSTPDARVIARAGDALIYLVQWDSTSSSTVRQGLAQLAELGVVPHGTVMTGVDANRIGEFTDGTQRVQKQRAFAG